MPNGGDDSVNKVVRFTETNGQGSNAVDIFSSSDQAGASNHNGGNIHFGPDGKLYISVGDDAQASRAQDVTVKQGKMHRIEPVPGEVSPADNPVFTQTGALDSLYARGLRNSFDFAFDPANGTVWASENGPGCDDELNHIMPGGNYGWRASYPCDDANPDATFNSTSPAWYLPDSDCCVAPTGVEFYRGGRLTGWENTLLMCDYNQGRMRHFYLDGSRAAPQRVTRVEGVRCNMDVQSGPDGALYYLEGAAIRQACSSASWARASATPNARAQGTNPAPKGAGPTERTPNPLSTKKGSGKRPRLNCPLTPPEPGGPKGKPLPHKNYLNQPPPWGEKF